MYSSEINAIEQLNKATISGYVACTEFHNWLIDIHQEVSSPEEKAKQDELRKYPLEGVTVRMIASWAYARDMEYQIDHMLPEKKAKEIAEIFDRDGINTYTDKRILTYQDLVSEEIAIKAEIEVKDEDEEDGPIFREVLNRQLKETIDHWQRHVENAAKYGYSESYEPYSRPEEFCDRRDVLEYAAAGIEMLRLGNHLLDLPYYNEYCKRLKALDVPFRKLLNGETVSRPYADRLFWWRQKK